MEEIKAGLFISPKCKLCNSVDRVGNPLRDIMDQMKSQGKATRAIVTFLRKEGVFANQSLIDRHFRLHSPWIEDRKRDVQIAKVNNALSRDAVEHRNADEELQKLVDMGAARIDNGEILVDKELYMFALDRKKSDTGPISIQNLWMNFGDALIESHKKNRVIEGVAIEPSPQS